MNSHRRSPSKKARAQSLDGSSSETPSHRIIRPVRNSSPVQDAMSIHVHDIFFSQEEDQPDNQSVDDPTLGSEQEKVDYSTLVDEVYKLLPSDRFPRKTNKQPRSAIELDLMLENSTKDVSFAQSNCTRGAFDCIKSSMGVEPDKDGVFQNPVSVPKDWCPENKNLKELISLSKSYQSHNETIPTARATKLDPKAHRLGLSQTGNFPVKVASLDMYERLTRESIKVLSHAETFSYAAFKSLQQEEMDTRILTKILESVSIDIRDCISISTVQALALQQTRREAAISSASKPLSEMTEQKLRSVPLNSSLLFGGQIEEIYRKNTDSNREDLVKNAATQLSKLAKFSSLPKPKSKPGKKKTVPKAQETPKPQFAISPQDPLEVVPRIEDLILEVEEVAPLIEEPLPLRSTEGIVPLFLPLPNIQVGGRLGHFAQNWANITDDKWVLSVARRGYKIPFRETPVLYRDLLFFQQPLSQQLEEEVANLFLKGAVEEIIPECPGFYSRIFLVPKKNGKLRLIIDLSALNHFVDCQSFKMETQRKVRNAIRPNDWAFSLDLTDAYLHVLIHPSSRKYLRFTLRGRVYQFKALAFSLSTSPLVFTCLMSVIVTFLRARAKTLHPYLDDWLTRNQNRRVLLEHRQFLLSLINSLGLIINYEKSDLVPAQVFTFIGMEFLTQT